MPGIPRTMSTLADRTAVLMPWGPQALQHRGQTRPLSIRPALCVALCLQRVTHLWIPLGRWSPSLWQIQTLTPRKCDLASWDLIQLLLAWRDWIEFLSLNPISLFVTVEAKSFLHTDLSQRCDFDLDWRWGIVASKFWRHGSWYRAWRTFRFQSWVQCSETFRRDFVIHFWKSTGRNQHSLSVLAVWCQDWQRQAKIRSHTFLRRTQTSLSMSKLDPRVYHAWLTWPATQCSPAVWPNSPLMIMTWKNAWQRTEFWCSHLFETWPLICFFVSGRCAKANPFSLHDCSARKSQLLRAKGLGIRLWALRDACFYVWRCLQRDWLRESPILFDLQNSLGSY